METRYMLVSMMYLILLINTDRSVGKQVNVIYKKRGEGKTEEIIKRSDKTGCLIVTVTRKQAKIIRERAKEMGCYNVNVLSYDEFKIRESLYIGKSILLDDAEYLLQRIFNHQLIDTISITNTNCET